jgi:hypothetical protein
VAEPTAKELLDSALAARVRSHGECVRVALLLLVDALEMGQLEQVEQHDPRAGAEARAAWQAVRDTATRVLEMVPSRAPTAKG